MLRIRRGEKGFTVAELVMVAALISILAGMAMPVAKYTVKRRKEAELRSALRQMRTAIDEYKRLSDQGMIPLTLGSEGYPPELEVLAEGIDLVGQETKRKFLRKIPIDPMTNDQEWGLRSYQDEPDAKSWGGENIWDVFSLSESVAIDGSEYKDW